MRNSLAQRVQWPLFLPLPMWATSASASGARAERPPVPSADYSLRPSVYEDDRIDLRHSDLPPARCRRGGGKVRREFLAKWSRGPDLRLRRLKPGQPGKILPALGENQDEKRRLLRRPARKGAISRLSAETVA